MELFSFPQIGNKLFSLSLSYFLTLFIILIGEKVFDSVNILLLLFFSLLLFYILNDLKIFKLFP